MTGLKASEFDVAIIGMAGRFPGGANLREFWANLIAGRETISFFSEQELLSAGEQPSQLKRDNYISARGVLQHTEDFDAEFFGFTPREAELLDPQHRVFLECAWESLEDAGITPESYAPSIGIFAGVGISTYFLAQISGEQPLTDPFGSLLHNDRDFFAARVAYKLGLTGPAVVVSTACSTSLAATHLACKALLAGECGLALAGGASFPFPATRGYVFSEGGIFSRDGHCRSFDSRASGTVPGAGAGVVVLKRLEDAVADRDHVYAVIKGTAMNNDGARKVGFTAPSVEGQAEVIRLAQEMSELSAEQMSFVEAHGTATAIGDPIELQALTTAFRETTARTGFCALGSVKSNIGHAGEAAGTASLIKAALTLETRTLPASLHYERPNTKFDLEASPFFVNAGLRTWPEKDEVLSAGVSSFGIGGTNVHVVMQQAPSRPPGSAAHEVYLVTLSARSEDALRVQAERLAGELEAHPGLALSEVAYTLHVGRATFGRRWAAVCRTREEGISLLRQRARATLPLALQPTATHLSVIFFFPGKLQDAMFRSQLYRSESSFRSDVDRCLRFLSWDLAISAENIGFKEPLSSAGSLQSRPGLSAGSFPEVMAFIMEWALARLWMHWGVPPVSVCGTGAGEYAAAAIAGIFTPEDALRLLVIRARSLQTNLAPTAPQGEIFSILSAALAAIELHEPTVPYASARTRFVCSPDLLTTPGYWANRLVQGFAADTGEDTGTKPCEGVIEVSMDAKGLGLSSEDASCEVACTDSGTPNSVSAALLATFGRLWTRGVSIDWTAFHSADQLGKVSLPTYPFERRLYIVEGARRALLPVQPSGSTVDAPADTPTSVEIGAEAPEPDDLQARLRDRVRDIWRGALGIAHITDHEDFFAVGGDSLTAMQINARLSEIFEVKLPLAELYANPTIAHLSAVLEQLLLDRLEALSEEEMAHLQREDEA